METQTLINKFIMKSKEIISNSLIVQIHINDLLHLFKGNMEIFLLAQSKEAFVICLHSAYKWLASLGKLNGIYAEYFGLVSTLTLTIKDPELIERYNKLLGDYGF